jgi:hypothetical protein
MSKVSNILRSERGESLVTISIALAILVMAGLLAAPTIMNSMKSQKLHLQTNSFCRDLSRNILAQIRSNGLQTRVHRAPASEDSVRFNDTLWRTGDGSYNKLNPKGVVDEHGLGEALLSGRWPDQEVMAWDNSEGHFVSHGPRLLHSSMNLLQTVNNSFGNRSCVDPMGLPIDASSGLQPLLPQDTLDQYAEAGYFVSAHLKTQPYRVADDTLLPCDGNLNIRPYGEMEPPRTDQMGLTGKVGATPSARSLANRYDPSLGIRAEVIVTIDNVDPTQREQDERKICSTTEKFQYNRVLSDIPRPELNTPDIRIRVSRDAGTPLKGVFLACTYEWYTVSLNPFSITDSGGDITQWVPCNRVSVCGGGAPSINETESEIVVDFGQTPTANCSFSMVATTFDAVGNTLSDAPMINCYGTDCNNGGGPGDNPGVSPAGGPSGSNAQSGYQVAGATYTSYSAAQAASTLTGAPVRSIEITDMAAAAMNSASMNSHASSMSNISSATQSVMSSIGGLGVADVSGAQAAVSSAQSNVSAAQNAVADAQNMPDSMGAAKDAAIEEAEEALEEAEAALKAAEEALEAEEEEKDEQDKQNP